MVNKFKVGDIIVPNSKANKYGVTNTKNNWIGKIVIINSNSHYFDAITIGSSSSDMGMTFCSLYDDCFKLKANTWKERYENE